MSKEHVGTVGSTPQMPELSKECIVLTGSSLDGLAAVGFPLLALLPAPPAPPSLPPHRTRWWTALFTHLCICKFMYIVCLHVLL